MDCKQDVAILHNNRAAGQQATVPNTAANAHFPLGFKTVNTESKGRHVTTLFNKTTFTKLPLRPPPSGPYRRRPLEGGSRESLKQEPAQQLLGGRRAQLDNIVTVRLVGLSQPMDQAMGDNACSEEDRQLPRMHAALWQSQEAGSKGAETSKRGQGVREGRDRWRLDGDSKGKITQEEGRAIE